MGHGACLLPLNLGFDLHQAFGSFGEDVICHAEHKSELCPAEM